MAKYNIGQKLYIVENASFVKEVIIVSFASGFYTIKYPTGKGAFRVRESRIYASELEAKQSLRK